MNQEGHTLRIHRRIKIEKPSIRTPEEEYLWKQVDKYSKMIPLVPDPNEGRLQEIKDEILRGTYMTPDKIDSAALRLTVRFLKKE